MKTQEDNSVITKAGRPRKQMKKDQRLTLVCTKTERVFISKWAKERGLTVSEYLRVMAFTREEDIKPEFSREARPLLVQLNYLLGNLKEMLEKEQGMPFTALKLAGIKSILQQVSNLQTTLMPYTN
ncbi:hypothetical protein [Sediminibacterium sp.]|uniref:plasmid mobilization protein n=1 Tax=Sediminibacterium sp. TaxID=1917865 RepID=UPI0027300EF0|nr:hypothetical protein [Sediminibacterium sp.]MDP1973966.1 hypothetical protein [Sediminibacterium sp.]MDP2421470.1 hypothetical protein [Sediminibacterium sp.]